MATDIPTGSLTSSPDGLQPLDASGSPGVGPPTAIQPGQLSGPTYPGRDLTGERLSQLAGDEAAIAAAQSAGMGAENGRRQHYQQDILPVGTAYGDAVDLPLVPDAATPASQSDLYPWAGMEPTPAGVGFYHGDEPVLPE